MEKTSLKKYIIYEIIFICVLATIMHFAFDFFNQNVYIGAFVPVNESVWEHLKLPFFASIISYIVFNKKLTYNNLNLLGTFIAIIFQFIFIPFCFYLFKDVFSIESMVIDILILYIAIIISIILKYVIIKNNKELKRVDLISRIAIFIMTIMFVIFTYVPPKMEIFKDKVSNIYGLNIY